MTANLNKTFIAKLLVIQILCGMLSLSLGVKWAISLDLYQYNNKIYHNIVVSGIPVGGLTREKAQQMLKTQYIDKILKQKMTLTLDKKSFSVPIQAFFTGSDLKETVDTAYNYPNHLNTFERWLFLFNKAEKEYTITLYFDEKIVDAYVENIIALIEKSASNAAIKVNKDGVITLTPHSDGYVVNKQKLMREIYSSLTAYSGKTINIADYADKKSAVLTTADLKTIDSCIVSFSTAFTPHTGKATNIALSSKAIDGILLAPNEVFSFNRIVGDTTADKGYKYAPVIINSQISQGVGGGVCQVSSTLYNAILRAGLSPSSRKPHSQPVHYVPAGLDATVSWNSIDFQFKNTFKYPVYIQSYVKDDLVYVNLYSNHTLKKHVYELNTEIHSFYTPSVKYLSQYQQGSKTEAASLKREGYEVKVTRNVYTQNKLEKTELISIDTY